MNDIHYELFKFMNEHGRDNTQDIHNCTQVYTRWVQISPARIYECAECGQNVMTDDIRVYRYCHGCGRKVKWDA